MRKLHLQGFQYTHPRPSTSASELAQVLFLKTITSFIDTSLDDLCIIFMDSWK